MNEQRKHILFLTSNNLSTNPRCVKEIELALSQGYRVTLVAFEFLNWSPENEDAIRKRLPGVEYHYISVDRKKIADWFFSAVTTVLCRLICRIYKRDPALNSFAFDRRSWLALRFLKRTMILPDLIIAHNPGVFYPAWKFSQRNKIRFAIDMEDYHPGEGKIFFRRELISVVIRKLLKHASYVSYASPLIRERTELLSERHSANDIVVSNVFSRYEFIRPVTAKGKLRLIWFSQHINYQRGLELVFMVLDQFANEIELTLIGKLNTEFADREIRQRHYIKLVEFMPSGQLHKAMSDYDIGLAIEPGKDDNNELAVSNKIWVYLQSGLYIIVSKTKAQEVFMKAHAEHGVVVNIHQQRELQQCLQNIISNKDRIRQKAQERYEAAQNISWETESGKLSDIWSSILN